MRSGAPAECRPLCTLIKTLGVVLALAALSPLSSVGGKSCIRGRQSPHESTIHIGLSFFFCVWGEHLFSRRCDTLRNVRRFTVSQFEVPTSNAFVLPSCRFHTKKHRLLYTLRAESAARLKRVTQIVCSLLVFSEERVQALGEGRTDAALVQ